MTEKRKYYLFSGAAALITAAVMLPVLFNGFINNYDDNVYILRNPYFQSFSWETVQTIFTSFYLGNYHPLTMLSYSIDHALWGMNPLFFHLVNLLLHVLNVVLVFRLFHLLAKRLDAAFIIALFFGIHPMHVESVAWISERKDVLYAFFFLASSISYIYYIRKQGGAIYLLLSLFLFALSLLSKSMAVTLTPLLLLFDLFEKRKHSLLMWAEKIPFLLLSLLFGILAIKSQGASEAFTEISPLFSIWERALIICHSIVFYLVKVFVPYPLSVIYHYPVEEGKAALTWSYYVAPFILAGIAILAWKLKKFRREMLFGFAFFLITISVVLQFRPVGQAMAADRYSYIPYLGLFFILAKIFTAISDREVRIFKGYSKLAAAIVIAFALAFSVLTFQRTRVWKDGITLFSDQIKNYPGNYYGYYVRAIGRLENSRPDLHAALQDLDASIRLNTSYALSYMRRGMVLHKLQRHREALLAFNTYVSMNPSDAEGYSNRGAVKLALGDLHGTAEDCSSALAMDKSLLPAWINRGNARGMMNDFHGSISDFSEVIRRDHSNALAYLNRGVSYHSLGDIDKACADWNTSAQLGNPAAAALLEQNCR